MSGLNTSLGGAIVRGVVALAVGLFFVLPGLASGGLSVGELVTYATNNVLVVLGLGVLVVAAMLVGDLRSGDGPGM